MVADHSPGLSRENTAPVPSAATRVRRRVKMLLLHPQLLLGFKAALAAGLAWALAMVVPGVAAQYPYYAPLGALVAMYPTVAGTAKQGLQTIIGLALGTGLGYGAVWAGGLNPFTVALVVGAGVLLSAILPGIGGGGHWIPTAGLFVLALGGGNIVNYSIGYFIQMFVGVGVGLAVSSLILPPLYFNDAVTRMTGLRRAVAQQIRDMGHALEQKWPPEDPRWAKKEASLLGATRGVREAVHFAGESRRGNLRSRFYPRDLARDYEHLTVLETVTFHVENITALLKDAVRGTSNERAVPAAMYEPLHDAFEAVGQVLDLWTINENDDEALTAAHTAMERLSVSAYESVSEQVPFDAASSIAMSLQRILKAITPLLSTTDSRPTDENPEQKDT